MHQRNRLPFLSPSGPLSKLVSLGLIWSLSFSSLPAYAGTPMEPLASLVTPIPEAALTNGAVAAKLMPRPVTSMAGITVAPRSAREIMKTPAVGGLGRIARPAALLQNAGTASIGVSVGFVDNSSPSANFPEPWNESNPAIIFIGSGSSYRAGAIRLDNLTTAAVGIDSVSVDLGRPGPIYQLWQNLSIPANGSAILTQTQTGNFNTSASPIVDCGQPLSANEARIPKITVTIAGNSTDYLDTAHVLDTGGFDSSCRGNQSLDWRPVGTTGIESPSGSIQLATDNADHAVGTLDTVSVQVRDAASQPLTNAPVTLQVLNGPNAGRMFSTTTDGSGA